jgi:hypothetical protein
MKTDLPKHPWFTFYASATLLAYQSNHVRRFKVAYGDDINVFAARMAQHAQKQVVENVGTGCGG